MKPDLSMRYSWLPRYGWLTRQAICFHFRTAKKRGNNIYIYIYLFIKLKTNKLNKLLKKMIIQLNSSYVAYCPSYLQQIYSLVLRKGIIPDDWRKAILLPIPKKGDRTYCNNHWRISLLDIFEKIFTFLLLNKLMAILNSRMRLK